MPAEYKRRRIWIDPPLQWRLLVRMAFYFLVYSGTLFHVAFLYEVMANLPEALARGMWALYVDFLGHQQPFLIACIAVMPVLLYDMLKFSHRIAGPLYRFRKLMDAMAAGKVVPEFKPRQRDLLRDLIKSFNGLIRKCNADKTSPPPEPLDEASSVETLVEEPAPVGSGAASS